MTLSIEKPRQYWFYICGFNLIILAALAFSLVTRLLGRWRGIAAAIVILTLYTLLVGGQPPLEYLDQG